MSQIKSKYLAAVDLGSNSFHMIVSSLTDDKLQTVDRLKETVRLAAGLNKRNVLNVATQNNAIACLERFGQRIKDFPEDCVRVVGTNTLRRAKNAEQFIHKAEQAIGHPIHVIAGIEEARLIYIGVSQSLAINGKKRFVMDIGGGSTEYIIGTGNKPKRKESLPMGCVSMNNLFFEDGKISKKSFQQAVFEAEQQLEPFIRDFHTKNWDDAVGASGSVRAIDKVLQATGWSNNGITLKGLKKLVDAICSKSHYSELDLPELSPDRCPVFPGAVAILYASFAKLGIEQMTVSDGALREGLLYDLLGRIHKRDIRSDTVAMLVNRYHTDQSHANRIKKTVSLMINKLQPDFIDNKNEIKQWLDWAADLHEIGHDIAHHQYHKHSAYIIQYGDLAGFSQQDQLILATIVRTHRKQFSKKRFNELPKPWREKAPILTILLRLAVLLNRSRLDTNLPDIKINIDRKVVELTFPADWITNSPLTLADLNNEADYLNAAKYKLVF